MPALDIYHNTVKNALIKDGWAITDDPLYLPIGERNLFVDLGAEKILTAERGETKIAVEIKSFASPSQIKDLEMAIGQFVLYRTAMRRIYPDRKLFLAIRDIVFLGVFNEPLGKMLLEDENISLLVFDSEQEVIVQWTN